MKIKVLLLFCVAINFASLSAQSEGSWIQLFNGKDLTGWDIKITGHELNDNYLNTFRVENGVLKCAYDQYKNFDDKFGHIYYRVPYSHYRLRVEYRFTGNQTPGGATWNVRNSGVMLHSQPAWSLSKDQTFPVSLEMQMLGGLSDGQQRATANLCTPGTMVEINGKLSAGHCINSSSKTYDGDQWVTVEMLVLGDSLIQHLVDGRVVFEFRKPIVADDEGMKNYLNMQGGWFEQHDGKPLKSGYIALQAESHPVEFRKVELLDLSKNYAPKLLPLKVSENRRHLTTAGGKPFFWLADTAWELFHRTTRQEAEFYLKTRAEQGFNVIQAVALAELDALKTPNRNGDLPLLNGDPAQPNDAYFRYVDTLVEMAAVNGLYVALLPTWGDKVFKNTWGVGPEIFNPQNARIYGKWIGNRYRNHPNIIWVAGGDRDPRDGSQDVEIWRALAAGIEEGVGGSDRAFMTFHTQPERIEASSSVWFHEDKWLDMNMLQTGHCDDTPVWQRMDADWRRSPAKPFLNGEAIYEEMPVCFDAKNLGYASAWDVRRAAWQSVLAGACGHTYGCGPVIFFSKKGEHFFADLHAWQEALELPAASQMQHLKKLVESRPMLERQPGQSLLAGEGNNAYDRIQAARGKSYAFIYTSHGLPVSVNMGKISGEKVTATWFDPRTGKSTPAGIFENKGLQTFAPPHGWFPVPDHRIDWVLVLDDAAMGYKMPD